MIMELLERLFKRDRPQNSSEEAKQRLQLVIAHDRAGLSSDTIELMRQEILEVVARYVEIDPEEMEFSLESDKGSSALIANLPIRRIRKGTNEASDRDQLSRS
jgi:cell division topological specificity factor